MTKVNPDAKYKGNCDSDSTFKISE